MRIVPLLIAAVVLSMPAVAGETTLARGQRLVEANCTHCHAIGESGASPHKFAPPFREVAKRYYYDELLDGFMEGLAVRHKDMPEWDMTEEQAEAVVTYIMSLKKAGTAKDDDNPVANGYTLVRKNCARCHAIGPAGESPLPKAPPFRTVVKRYDPATLQEPLAEGIVTGHNDMPDFAFSPEDVTAIIAYLQSLQKQ